MRVRTFGTEGGLDWGFFHCIDIRHLRRGCAGRQCPWVGAGKSDTTDNLRRLLVDKRGSGAVFYRSGSWIVVRLYFAGRGERASGHT